MRDMQNPAVISDALVLLHGAKAQAEALNLEPTAENIAIFARRSTWYIRELLRETDGVTGQRCSEVLGII
jgi:hypothetical protein